jgi:hypothetical protein
MAQLFSLMAQPTHFWHSCINDGTANTLINTDGTARFNNGIIFIRLEIQKLLKVT